MFVLNSISREKRYFWRVLGFNFFPRESCVPKWIHNYISIIINKISDNEFGHICRMPSTAIPRVDMHWPTDGKRKRGRTKEKLRRSVEREIKEKGWSWGEVVKQAKDKQHWLSLVTTLCADMQEGDQVNGSNSSLCVGSNTSKSMSFTPLTTLFRAIAHVHTRPTY